MEIVFFKIMTLMNLVLASYYLHKKDYGWALCAFGAFLYLLKNY